MDKIGGGRGGSGTQNLINVRDYADSVQHTAVVPAALLSEALPPFNITVAQTIDVNALGYDYASFSSRTLVGG